MAKKLMKGCEAIGEAAIQAGCLHFFGYPITPQTEIPEYLAKRLPEVDGVFVQAESEVASINMLYGSAGTGVRVCTSSSSPGISLMAEGISYIAGAELPLVLINIVRGGPGLGGILPAQSDYFQATKGMAHGDFKMPVYAPSTVQEAADLVIEAFDIADKYRNPVMVMGDGIIGQMMEPVEFPERERPELPEKDWATTGAVDRKPNIINSLYLDPAELEKHNFRLQEKYKTITEHEIRYEEFHCDQNKLDILMVAYGTTARICKTAVSMLKEEGIKAGLIRPITLWPFPYEAVGQAAQKARHLFVVEMSMGQMIEDVKLSLDQKRPVNFHGRCGGMLPAPDDVVERAKRILDGEFLEL
jgi:2-oxoglutarate ferredoxin oxidoreductase subunit alpha